MKLTNLKNIEKIQKQLNYLFITLYVFKKKKKSISEQNIETTNKMRIIEFICLFFFLLFFSFIYFI